MKELRLKVSLIKDGVERCVGYQYNVHLTQEEFIENAKLMIASCARKLLEIEGEFS